jgi:hypothetical protein
MLLLLFLLFTFVVNELVKRNLSFNCKENHYIEIDAISGEIYDWDFHDQKNVAMVY